MYNKVLSKIILGKMHFQQQYFVLLISATCSFLQLSAQENGNGEQLVTELMVGSSFKNARVIPPSPEAAGLGKFGNVPVSLFTGTPKVSLPLYELKGNVLSLPVQLSYNAAGFNPQEVAGWTGLGWSLSAGGVITRSVIGNPDVNNNYFLSLSPLDMPVTTDMIVYHEYLNKLRRGEREAQPDMYFFNFGGYSGKFLIKPDGTVVMFEKNNLKITHCVACSPSSSSFTITDPAGNIYEFTATEISTTTTDDGSTEIPVRQDTYASAWYLTKITSAYGGEEISLDYHALTAQHFPYLYVVPNQSKVYTFTVNTNNPPDITFPSSTAPVTGIQRRYLQKVTLKRGGQAISYIDFNSTADQRQDLGHLTNEFPGERMLNNLQVYTKTTGLSFALTKQFQFNYAYFSNTLYPADWKYKRLRLDQLQETAVSGGTVNPPPYQFEYNASTNTPPIGTASIDHWGFCNGNNAYSTTPNSNYISNEVVVDGTNRYPDLGFCASTVLNKIKYPTGGFTTFEYELHDAYVDGKGFIPIGGLRVKKIMDYSFDTQKATEKNYQYSGGKAKYPVYKSFSNYIKYGVPPGGNGWNSACNISAELVNKNIVTVSSTSIMGLGSVAGSHVGYSTVTEKQVDAVNGQPLGKTVYEYELGGEWGELNNEDVKNGELLKQTVYDNSNKIIQAVENQYNSVPVSGMFSVTAIRAFPDPSQNNLSYLVKASDNQTQLISYHWLLQTACLANTYTFIDAREIKVKSFPYGITYNPDSRRLQQQTTKLYDQATSSYITSVKKYSYGNSQHLLATSVEQTTNNNEVVITEKKYPLDYTVGGSGDANMQGIASLQNMNVVGAEIESYQYRQNPDGSNKRYIGGAISNYSAGLPYPANIWSLETAQPLTSFAPSAVNNGVFTQHPNYKLAGSFSYSTGGTIVQQTKAQDIPSAYLWAYNNSLPIAEVVNATPAEIAYSSFETDEGGSWNSSTGFIINRATGGITGNYSFNVGTGNFSKTGLPSKKYIVSYWSKNGTLTVSPAPSSTKTGQTIGLWTYYEHLLPLTTSVTLSGAKSIDELRLYPEKALMSTITYNYYSGQINSQCSPANKISRFDYDGLQRLVNVKDEFGNIVKNYKYNYSIGTPVTPSTQTLFYSDQKQGVFYKQGCSSDAEPAPYTYIVGYGKYASIISVAAANVKADADVAANGQQAANENGLCYYWNDQQSQIFYKTNCAYWEGPPDPNGYPYTVPAHLYSSLISKADANAKAIADINASGQNYINSLSLCSCSSQGSQYRYVYGQCELGQISYVGYSYEPGCAPGMNYRCYYKYTWTDGYHSAIMDMCSAIPCQNY
jgi:hypothetical protein